MSVVLNLASRPFRNERLPRLLLVSAWVAALALSAAHAVVALALRPARASERQAEAARLEAKLRRSAPRVAAANAEVSPDDLRLWGTLKNLVDRRTFSWTGLLGDLERVVPAGVRIVLVTPEQKDGRTELKLEALARTPGEALDFLHTLEARPQFSFVYPLNVGDDSQGLRRVSYSMTYEPQAAAVEVRPLAATAEQP